MRIFLSHSSEDAGPTAKIAKALRAHGIECWTCEQDLPGGQPFADRIMHAIQEADGMVLVVTAASCKSPHIANEIHSASDANKAIYPFFLERVTLPPQISYYVGKLNHIHVWDDTWKKQIGRLASAILSAAPADGSPGPAVPPPAPARRSWAPALYVAALVLLAAVVVTLRMRATSRSADANPSAIPATVSTEPPTAPTASSSGPAAEPAAEPGNDAKPTDAATLAAPPSVAATIQSAVAPQADARPDNEAPLSPYEQLADRLARRISQDRVRVVVGNFVYGDSGLLSAFSSRARVKMEAALAASGRFQVVRREELTPARTLRGVVDEAILDPDMPVAQADARDVDAVLRGRYYDRGGPLEIVAELVWLRGDQVLQESVDLPPEVGWDLADTAAPPWVPVNLEQSMANLQQLSGTLGRVGADFALGLGTVGGRRDFAGGEPVSYVLSSETNCYVAVLCYQADGSTVLLYPNAWSRDFQLAAGQTVILPDPANPTFRIVAGPPYGADVIQAVACTRLSALHQLLSGQVPPPEAPERYAMITRGMVVEGLKDVDERGEAKWSSAHLVVCTYPAAATEKVDAPARGQ